MNRLTAVVAFFAMKKTLLNLCFAFFAVLSMHGSVSKFDGYTRILFERASARSGAPVRAFVTVAEDVDPESFGLTCLKQWPGGVMLVSGSIDALATFAECGEVTAIAAERPVRPANNLAATSAGVTAIHEGAGLDGISYTGKNVVVGLFDSGFDVQNPSFANADGTSRIARIFHYSDDSGTPAVYSVPAMINAFVTDDSDNCHGSHVLGTMAGNYDGPVDHAVITAEGGVATVRSADSPFDGMAPEATIAIACGALTDANIADGISRIAAYAKSAGKPCVINLSLSDILGPHDGSDPFAQAMSAVARDAIIVVSSGNYAGSGVSLSRTFCPGQGPLRSFLRPVAWKHDADGVVSVWSSTATPLELSIVVYDTNGKVELARFKAPVDPEGEPLVLTTPDYEAAPGRPEPSPCPELGKAYTNSYIAVYPTVAPSGRHGYYIDFYIDINPDNRGAYIAAGIEAAGLPGRGADMYIDSDYCELRGLWVDGWSEGGDDMSVSSMACAPGLVCVGAYATRPVWATLGGETVRIENYENYTPDGIAPFSSYGRLRDGRILPHVAAPGAALVSVFSTPYAETHPGLPVVASSTSGSRKNYWRAEYGTSMSSPLVAGAIALWLEADSSLDSEEILSILEACAVTDAAVEAAPERWGYGRFDAFAGLKEVLRRASVNIPSADAAQSMQLRVSGKTIEVLTSDSEYDAVLFTLSGTAVDSARASNNVAVVEAPSSGMYLVRAGGMCRKVAVR